MGRRVIFLVLSLYLFIQVGLSQDMVLIKGEVSGDTQGYNKVYIMDAKSGRDSATISQGRFELQLPYNPGMEPYLFIEAYMRPGKMQEPFPFIIDRPGVLYLKNIDPNRQLHEARASGMQSMVDYQVFLDHYFVLKDSLASISSQGHAYKETLAKSLAVELSTYMDHYSSSYAAPFVLDKVKTLIEIEELQGLYQKLASGQRDTEKGKEIASYIQNALFAQIGSDISALTYTDQDGELKSLADLKGKYLLIDFWASWCGPCIKGFSHLRNLYEKYKGAHFEVLGISIDKKAEDWVQAYKKYDLPWINGIDRSDNMQSRLLVTAVPTLFLLDPEGKIIMKEIGLSDKVDQTLEKIFQKIEKP